MMLFLKREDVTPDFVHVCARLGKIMAFINYFMGKWLSLRLEHILKGRRRFSRCSAYLNEPINFKSTMVFQHLDEMRIELLAFTR